MDTAVLCTVILCGHYIAIGPLGRKRHQYSSLSHCYVPCIEFSLGNSLLVLFKQCSEGRYTQMGMVLELSVWLLSCILQKTKERFDLKWRRLVPLSEILPHSEQNTSPRR